MQWKEIEPNSNFFVLEYQAKGYSRTNCCAIGTTDGYLILSPASDVTEAHIEFLEKRAPLKALLPPHPGHTLGVGDWTRLRPQLPIYAAPAAIPRLEKVCKIKVQPISQLKQPDAKIKISLAPGMGETTLLVESFYGRRPVAYVDELLEDLDRIPGPWLLRPLMKVMGKVPGFHVNRGFIRFFVKDKKILAAEILKRIDENAHLVFAHGPVRSGAEDLSKSQQLLESV